MNDTNFEDCCGLTDSPTHVTTAKDIAIMSRELITKYPQIHNYSTIWMENITHVTKQGTREFGLSNTNRLLKMGHQFPGDRVKDRLYIHSEILPVCHGRKGRDRTDRCGNGGTRL